MHHEEIIQKHFEEGKFELAFNVIVDYQQEQLLRVILRIVGSEEESRDLLQDTFVKIWQNLRGFKGNSKWSTWTYRIASNEALMHLRRRKKWLTTSDPAVTDQLEGSSFFDGDEATKALYQSLDKLPAKQRLVFQMRYFDNMPYSEISQVTGTSIGALKASYHHASKRIEDEVMRFKRNVDLNIKEVS